MSDDTDPNRRQRLAGLRRHLREARGRGLWRSLDELAQTDAFKRLLREEFPYVGELGGLPLGRRRFLQLMGASLALGGLTGCDYPPEAIVPYVDAPPELKPGEALFYATAMPLDGYVTGVLAESNMGRPTKIEGNPAHPASVGATDVYMQASVLQLWDPERAQTVMRGDEVLQWGDAARDIAAAVHHAQERDGEGLRILTDTLTSPTLASQIRELRQRLPKARWHQYQPVHHDNSLLGALHAFGRPVDTHYRFDRAQVILSLDADFLAVPPGHLRYARDFARRRKVKPGHLDMNRLYVAQSAPGITGAVADHRVDLRPSSVVELARAIAGALGVAGVREADRSRVPRAWAEAVVADLKAHRSAGLVLAGERQPPEVHVLAHAMNAALGNAGTTLEYRDSAVFEPDLQVESLKSLTQDMAAGHVHSLFILGPNPVYTAPADLAFGEALTKVPFSLYLGLYRDETAKRCTWHVPESHYLESWGDGRAYDGTVSIIQPLISPLYRSRSRIEVMAALLGDLDASAYSVVHGYWRKAHADDTGFDAFWTGALHAGVVPHTRAPAVDVRLREDALAKVPQAKRPPADALEIAFAPDPSIWDGQFANNAWLQELPKPLTKLTWDNAALVSPDTAARLGADRGDVVELTLDGRRVEAPILVDPGHAEGCVTVHLGYGRAAGGTLGAGPGFDAYRLRTSQAPWAAAGLQIKRTGRHYKLAITQGHFAMEGRHLVRHATLDEFRDNPGFAHDLPGAPEPFPSLFPEYKYPQHKWGMSVNLGSCIGCNACITACQAENNIPVVGKEQVRLGREMLWLRVDTYYEGPPQRPQTHFQPVPCMQCEDAPCEIVCPVEATLHDSGGINVQVYNRCIGTRFCSNNCPYKVRRFNFLQYSKDSPTLNAQRNPEVTVRQRGVMEKCNYCLQRIANAKIRAQKEDRPIEDGEVLTACQAACPTEAIVFGDLNDRHAKVVDEKTSPLDYTLLGELNTKPRTTYTAKVTNPNPALRRRPGKGTEEDQA